MRDTGPTLLHLIGIDHKRFTYRFSTYFGRILDRVGIPGKSFHDLRSSYIVDCDKRGIPIEHISRNVGHVSSVTTRGYMPKRD